MPSFREQTSSFFDELSSILDEQKKAREKAMGPPGGSRPFSTELTQDEEPTTEYYSPSTIEEQEPEVIMRGG